MNCPSRTDPEYPEGWNQNPQALNAHVMTRADLDHVANARSCRDHRLAEMDGVDTKRGAIHHAASENPDGVLGSKAEAGSSNSAIARRRGPSSSIDASENRAGNLLSKVCTTSKKYALRMCASVRKYFKFIGPGLMVSVAYIDPGRKMPLRLSLELLISKNVAFL